MAARNVLDYRKPPNHVNLLHLAMVCYCNNLEFKMGKKCAILAYNNLTFVSFS